MTRTIHFYLLFLLYCSASCKRGHDDIIYTEDRPYDVIDIKVPREIWNKALNPTPVLKSPVTIVVPVHVPDEENDVDEDNVDLEDTVDPEDVLNDIVATTVANDVIQEVANDTTAIANATETPLEDPAQPVTGQVTRFPCSCPSGQCGCCTGTILNRIKMNACGNISFVPEDFVFDVRLTINNRTVVRRRVSASDPPPICFNPRRAPFVEVCAEISNIRIRNQNAFACLDINANIGGLQIYSASFRCFGLGTKGVQTGLKPKPNSSGPKPISLYGNSESESEGGILEDITGGLLGEGGLLGGGEGGFFGGGGSDDDDDDGGPFEGIGEAVGDFFGRRL